MKDIIRMNQLAGIITESQAKKMMAILNEEQDIFDEWDFQQYLETLMDKTPTQMLTPKPGKYDITYIKDKGEYHLFPSGKTGNFNRETQSYDGKPEFVAKASEVKKILDFLKQKGASPFK